MAAQAAVPITAGTANIVLPPSTAILAVAH
jgi:hypothetical protein